MSEQERIPGWMIAVSVLLMIAILGVLGALAWNVFTVEEVPLTKAERDIVYWEDQVAQHPAEAGTLSELGGAYLSAEEYGKALEQAEKAIEIDSKDLGGYYVKAAALRAMGQYQQAIDVYDQILELVPVDAEALFQKGMTYKAIGDVEEAIAQLEKALEAQPGASDVRVELARIYRQQGKPEEARAQYEEALRYVPDYQPALAGLESLKTE